MSYPKSKLGEVATIVTGSTPSKENESYWNGNIPFVTPSELDADQDVISTASYVTNEGASIARLVPKNSIMVCCIGSLGKVGVAGCNLLTNQQINTLVFDPKKVYFRYGYHFCKTLKPYLEHIAPSTTIAIVNKSRFSEIEIPLPSLEEQKRIAAILDKADSLRRKRAQAIALADDFLRATFLDMFGDPVTNPKGWPVKPLGTLIEKIKSGWSAPSTDAEYIEGTLGVLKVSAVSSGYFKRAEAKVVDPSIVDRDLIFPVMGDLLFSRANTRELVAAACLVEEDCESAFLPDKLWQITCSHGVARNEYLKFLLADLKFKDELTKKATGTSGSMLNISQAKFVETNAPIPPYELQSRFADAVWRVYSLRKKWFESDYSIGNLFRGLSSDL